MSNIRNRKLGVFVAGIALATAPQCFAQLLSNSPTVMINATLAEVLVVAASPSTLSIPLSAGTIGTATVPVVITTTWVLASGRSNVVLDGYFASATQALSGGTPVSYIPSSEVSGQMTTGTPTTYTPFSSTAALGTASAGLTLFTQALTTGTRASSRTDNLMLQINLTSQPQLPAAIYTGSLILQAQAL